MEDESKEIEDLRKRLREARDSYYNLSPVIDDKTYDTLKERLAQIDPTHEEVIAVGAEPPKISVWDKVEHLIPMGSLNKVNSEQEMIEWAERIGSNVDFLMCHKMDGSSLELIYENGILKRGVTRGDGKVGEDITENIIQTPSIPKKLKKPIPGTSIVRGEVVMHKDTFNKLYADSYANPRNTAAGKIRDKKGQGRDCENLNFYAFELILEQLPKSEFIQFQALTSIGFDVPWYSVGTIDHIVKEFEAQIEKRQSLPYEIDGEVISINDMEKQKDLGSLHMRPKGKIAWKFEAEMGLTTAEDVKWQVGPTGRLCPVLVVKPVSIGGVTITNISLHNVKMFRNLQLAPGDEVLISRRNDVIPYCEKNVTKDLTGS